MPQEFIHAVLLISSMGAGFILSKSALAQYDIHIAAIIFVLYYSIKKIAVPKDNTPHPYRNELLRITDSVVFTYVIIIIINSSGGLSSPLFFLTYFLIFALSLILEPIISVAATIGLVILYILSIPPNSSIKELLPLFALPFLTPFALFLGQEHLKNLKLKSKNEKLNTEHAKKEEDTFLFLSLVLKNHIKEIKSAIDNFIGDHELMRIRKHTREMEKAIEKFENK